MTKKRFEALNWASSFLKSHQKDENAGEILLQHRLDVNRTGLLSDLHAPLSPEDWNWFYEKVTEHALNSTPVQHITGTEFFYGRPFKVNRACSDSASRNRGSGSGSSESDQPLFRGDKERDGGRYRNRKRYYCDYCG